MYTIEVKIFVLHKDQLDYNEIPMEIEFDFNPTTRDYEILSYEFDVNEVRKENPSIDRKIERAIDHFIENYEPEYLDCE